MAAAHTLYLGESLLMRPANLGMFVLQCLQTSAQRVRNFQAVIMALGGTAGPGILHGGFHLADGGNHILGLRDNLFLLLGHKAHLVVQGLGQGCEQLCVGTPVSLPSHQASKKANIVLRRMWVGRRCFTYLCLSGFAIMAGDADLVKEAVQLANDGVDLLGKVAGVHFGGD